MMQAPEVLIGFVVGPAGDGGLELCRRGAFARSIERSEGVAESVDRLYNMRLPHRFFAGWFGKAGESGTWPDTVGITGPVESGTR